MWLVVSDFIVETEANLPDEDVGRRMHRHPLPLLEDEQEDVEALERSTQARYARSSHTEYDEETIDVEQQALLSSNGREQETAVCLMQKFIDKVAELQIRFVIALDHLKNYIYVEADKEAYARETFRSVEKVEEENVHIRPEMKGLPKTLAVNKKELYKYFEPGNHVKVLFGTKEGATVVVIKIRVFADDVVESSEVTIGITKIEEYELLDLVLLDNSSFGVIICVESEAFQVLKGVPERPEVSLVKLREVKCKLEKKFNVQDRYWNTVSVKDVVRILEGPCKGKQGPVEYIYKGVLFVYERHHLEHAGFICAKADSCCIVGGSSSSGDRNGGSFSRFGGFKAPPRVLPSPRRFSRGAPAPGSGWASTPGGNYGEAGTLRDSSSAYANAPSPYMPSTPSGQPMAPSSGSYIPSTLGGQPMTPGTGGLDIMSPVIVIGADSEGPWFMPDILVNVRKSGDETLGVIQEVLPVGVPSIC